MDNLDNEKLIDQYIYEACKYLEYNTAMVVREDLKVIIAEKQREGCEVEEILNQLGNPYALGNKYQSKGNLLISGKFYDLYTYALKTSLIGVILGVVSFLIFFRLVYGGNFIFLWFFRNTFECVVVSFAFITISFTLVEWIKNKKIAEGMYGTWTTVYLRERAHVNIRKIQFFWLIIILVVYPFMLLYSEYYISNSEEAAWGLKYLVNTWFFLSLFKWTLKVTILEKNLKSKKIIRAINLSMIVIVLLFYYIVA